MNYIEKEIVSFKSLQRERYIFFLLLLYYYCSLSSLLCLLNYEYRREGLNVDEMALERECGMFEKRIENIETEELAMRIATDDTKSVPKVPKTNFNKINEAVPPEVVALQVLWETA